MKHIRQLALISLICMALMACGGEPVDTGENNAKSNETDRALSLFLDWTPNTNHSGIYIAIEKGFYEEAGLDLEVLLPGEVSTEQLVATDKGEFGISFQDQMTQARSQDLPIVSIAAVIQEHTGGYASPVEKEIESPKDFVGNVYGASAGTEQEEAILNLVMERDGSSAEDVDTVQLGNSDFFVATKKDIDFSNIFYGWAGIEAEIKGVKLNFVKTADYAEQLNTYSPVIISSEKMIEEDPETVQDFVSATVKGYEFAIDHPAETADILIEAESDLDPELVERSQEWLSPRYQDEADQWGVQESERWEAYADFLFEEGIIEKEIDATEAFTNEFIEGTEE